MQSDIEYGSTLSFKKSILAYVPSPHPAYLRDTHDILVRRGFKPSSTHQASSMPNFYFDDRSTSEILQPFLVALHVSPLLLLSGPASSGHNRCSWMNLFAVRHPVSACLSCVVLICTLSCALPSAIRKNPKSLKLWRQKFGVVSSGLLLAEPLRTYSAILTKPGKIWRSILRQMIRIGIPNCEVRLVHYFRHPIYRPSHTNHRYQRPCL